MKKLFFRSNMTSSAYMFLLFTQRTNIQVPNGNVHEMSADPVVGRS